MTTKTDTLVAEAKAEALRDVAALFDQQYHSRFSGTDVAKILRAAAAEALDDQPEVDQ